MEYEIIESPEIQEYMDLEGFEEHATLITPNKKMGIGSKVYLVEAEWLKLLNEMS